MGSRLKDSLLELLILIVQHCRWYLDGENDGDDGEDDDVDPQILTMKMMPNEMEKWRPVVFQLTDIGSTNKMKETKKGRELKEKMNLFNHLKFQVNETSIFFPDRHETILIKVSRKRARTYSLRVVYPM